MNDKEYKVTKDSKEALDKICSGTLELDWSSAALILEEENLIVGMIVGHETYVKKILSYLPDNFKEEMRHLYQEMENIHTT